MGLLDWLLPPNWRSLLQKFKAYGYSGNYANWSAAAAASAGYADDHIFSQVKQAALAVKAGKAAFDRDSVLFERAAYDYPVLSALLYTAQQQNQLQVLDFGGATGSMYYQYKALIRPIENLRWLVVEQAHFVAFGQAELQDETLRFYSDLKNCQATNQPNLAILGCVLPYLDNPYHWLAEIYQTGIPYVLIDKHPIIPGETDRLTVQKTNPKVYKASYPAWFFGEQKFKAALEGRYELIFEYDCPDQSNIPLSSFKGYFLKRIE